MPVRIVPVRNVPGRIPHRIATDDDDDDDEDEKVDARTRAKFSQQITVEIKCVTAKVHRPILHVIERV